MHGKLEFDAEYEDICCNKVGRDNAGFGRKTNEETVLKLEPEWNSIQLENNGEDAQDINARER